MIETAKEGDSINFSVPNSETRRGRVGKSVAQTLDTACNQGIMVSKEIRTQESKDKRDFHKKNFWCKSKRDYYLPFLRFH